MIAKKINRKKNNLPSDIIFRMWNNIALRTGSRSFANPEKCIWTHSIVRESIDVYGGFVDSINIALYIG